MIAIMTTYQNKHSIVHNRSFASTVERGSPELTQL